MLMELNLQFAILGAIGALASEIFDDGCITIPNYKDGKLYMGFLGAMIIGSIAAMIADNDPLTAITAGFTAYTVLPLLLKKKLPTMGASAQGIETTIRQIAQELKVDANLAVKVAKCESGLNPTAIYTNTTGSRDRGLFQINDKWHPEVTDEQAFDIDFSTRFFCNAVLNGNISWWDASKNCWGA